MAISPEQFYGLIAVKNGFLTKAQLNECFTLQVERLERTGIHEPLSYLLYELGYMDYTQMRDVLHEFKYSCLRKDDKDLARIGLEKGYLNEQIIERVLEKQREMFRAGIGVFQLGEILITNEILTQQQVFELYCELWLRRNPGRELPPAALKALEESRVRTSTASDAAVEAEPSAQPGPSKAVDEVAQAEPARVADREQKVMRDPGAGFKICPVCDYRNPAVAEICYGCGESLAGAKVVQPDVEGADT